MPRFRASARIEANEDMSSDELSSDEELQEEFSKGILQPGLIARNAPLKTYTNNVAGMREKLAKLKGVELEWLERMDVTVAASETKEEEEEEEQGEAMDPEDDFKREMLFYHQAQSSAMAGLRKLEKLGVPTQRPEDYYAEMVKTDDHMRKVRQCLLSRQKMLEQKEKARKMRELKKYGKKVQHEILQKRREEKKATLDAVKKFKRGRGERPSFLDRTTNEDDSFPVATESFKQSAGQSGGKKRPMERSKKRVIKDKKFGFGGKKRWLKSNTAESSADMSSFNAAKHSRRTEKPGTGRGRGRGGNTGRGGGGRNKGTKGKKSVRLGKSRRQKMKLK